MKNPLSTHPRHVWKRAKAALALRVRATFGDNAVSNPDAWESLAANTLLSSREAAYCLARAARLRSE